MNKLYRFSLKALALAAISFAATPAKAQLGNIGDLLQAGKEDANTLAAAYISPYANGFAAGMNTGWVMGANVHGGFFPIPLPGFSLAARIGIVQIGDSDKNIDLTKLDFIAVEYDQAQSSTTPTLAGGTSTQARLISKEKYPAGTPNGLAGEPLFAFDLPGGTDFGYVPALSVQAGIGLMFDTDITVRYIPKYTQENFGSIELIGASVRHGLDQWIPAGGLIPVNITLQAAFTKLTASTDFSIDASSIGATSTEISYADFEAGTFDNQSLLWETTAMTANLLVGKKLSLLVIGIGAYVGAGLENSTSTITTKGNYPSFTGNVVTQTQQIGGVDVDVPVFDPVSGDPVKELTTVPDILNLEFKSETSFRLLGGVRFSLGIIDVFGEYTVGKYKSANVGFAVSFRS